MATLTALAVGSVTSSGTAKAGVGWRVKGTGSVTSAGTAKGRIGQWIKGTGTATSSGTAHARIAKRGRAVSATTSSGTARAQFGHNKARATGKVNSGGTARLRFFTPGAPDTTYPYRLVLGHPGTANFGEISKPIISSIVQSLNDSSSMSFTLAVTDPMASQITPPDTEVEVWRGTMMIDRMVIVRSRVNGMLIEYQCLGLDWYFRHRFIGTMVKTNLLENPTFDNASSSWAIRYDLREATSAKGQYRVVKVPGFGMDGGNTLLVQTYNTSPRYGMLTIQEFSHVCTKQAGDVVTAVVWAYVPLAFLININADNGRALSLELRDWTVTESVQIDGGGTVPDYKLIASSSVNLDETIPGDTWIRLETTLRVPYTDGVTQQRLRFVLQSPMGAVHWDEAALYIDNGRYFYNVDQASIVSDLVTYAQNVSEGKSNLYITPDCPPSGVTRIRAYPYSEHMMVKDALDEFPTLFNGMDWSVQVDTNGRRYRTYYPYRGRVIADPVLEVNKNIVDFSQDYDGEQTANSITVLGDGEAGSRQEAAYIDATSMPSGLVLEKVYNATPGSSWTSLQEQARRGVDRYKKPVRLPSITCKGLNELLGTVLPGDFVTIRATYGSVVLDGQYRITSQTINVQENTITYTVNPADVVAGTWSPTTRRKDDEVQSELRKLWNRISTMPSLTEVTQTISNSTTNNTNNEPNGGDNGGGGTGGGTGTSDVLIYVQPDQPPAPNSGVKVIWVDTDDTTPIGGGDPIDNGGPSSLTWHIPAPSTGNTPALVPFQADGTKSITGYAVSWSGSNNTGTNTVFTFMYRDGNTANAVYGPLTIESGFDSYIGMNYGYAGSWLVAPPVAIPETCVLYVNVESLNEGVTGHLVFQVFYA